MKHNHTLPSEQIRETLAAYKKISTLAKRVVGPVDLISNETLDESMNDVLATISEPSNAKGARQTLSTHQETISQPSSQPTQTALAHPKSRPSRN